MCVFVVEDYSEFLICMSFPVRSCPRDDWICGGDYPVFKGVNPFLGAKKRSGGGEGAWKKRKEKKEKMNHRRNL